MALNEIALNRSALPDRQVWTRGMSLSAVFAD